MRLEVQYLEHHEIDQLQWDNCISNAVNHVICAQSWYLNTAWEDWTALVSPNYQYVMPLFPSRKWGIEYLCQPTFIFQSGVFSASHLNKEIVDLFLLAIPQRFKYIEIKLNILNQISKIKGFEIQPAISYQLDLIKSFHHLVADFSLNTLQYLRNAKESSIFVNEELDALGFVRFIMLNENSHGKQLNERELSTIQRITSKAMGFGSGKILSAFTVDNTLAAAALFIGNGAKAIMLIAAESEEGKKQHALYMIVNYFIMTFNGSALTLDLGQSLNPRFKIFCSGFGAMPVHYPLVRKKSCQLLNQLFYH